MEVRELIRAAEPLLDALHDGVAIIDTRGVILFVNEANSRITGLSRAELLGRRVEEVVPGSHLPDVLAGGRAMIGVRSQVAGREVISNIVPLLAAGQPVAVVSIFRDLTEVVALGAQLREAQKTIARLKEYLSRGTPPEGVVTGRSPLAGRAFTLARRAAQVSSPVLIEGESGTGKEVVARLIHSRSDRAGAPFLAVNCAALPGPLLESELFGYEEGAFTGARRGGRAGLWEMADGGTLFLDEIGDMEPSLQAKLLRVLQDGEFRRLGSGALRRADVRVISATNQDLSALVAAHRFREDLFYRLRVIRIQLPPLRQRREDVGEFIEHALRRATDRLARPGVRIDAGAMRLLLAYDYPGNVRELENLVEQAVALDEDGLITEIDLPTELTGGRATAPIAGLAAGVQGRFPTWDEVEQAVLEAGLKHFSTKAALAAHLGMGRATLYRKLARHGLD